MKTSTPLVPSIVSREEFYDSIPALRQALREIEAARKAIETTALAGICMRLEELKAAHPEFSHATFFRDPNDKPQAMLRTSRLFSTLEAQVEFSHHQDEITKLFHEFAYKQCDDLALLEASLTGPDAASFARQMGRPDIESFVEAHILERAASRGAPANPKPTL